jgi:hypothetical protein
MEKMTARLSLLALLQITSGREIAARCGVHPSRVTEWAAGRTTPSSIPRQRLWTIYGIRPNGWGKDIVQTSSVRRDS